MIEKVVLVNEKDEPIGEEEKEKVHLAGKLHRAFSIFVFNSAGELLLQKRARSKYHSGGLWTNTCCGHPRPGEKIENAATRRLQEEMGFSCFLEEVFTFQYRANLDNGMIENEYDHVLRGKFDGEPKPNPDEAEGWKWIDTEALQTDVKANPDGYTHWFKLAINRLGELKKILI